MSGILNPEKRAGNFSLQEKPVKKKEVMESLKIEFLKKYVEKIGLEKARKSFVHFTASPNTVVQKKYPSNIHLD
jgi:hypothetical protein